MEENIIPCEDIMSAIWSYLSYLENEPIAQQTLQSAYEEINHPEAQRLVYENTYPFIYLVKQGRTYFSSAEESDLLVQPLLYYYGCSSYMKALILLKDPDYPQTTAVLQHGLTSRKKKRKNYAFLKDEVKIQREGLLPYFCKLIFQTHLTVHQKYQVQELLGLLSPFRFHPITPYQSEHPEFKSELPVYFMLMYLLSMLSRYDAEIWGELLFSFQSPDLFTIQQLLQSTRRHFPHLVLNTLSNRKFIFTTHD